MFRVFLCYRVNGKIERIRAEKEIEADSVLLLWNILENVRNSVTVTEWEIRSRVEPSFKLDDYLLME